VFVEESRSWPRALAGGVAGTTAMTLALALEAKFLPSEDGLIDYDSSDHVVIAACAVLRRPVPRSRRGRRRIFRLVHWGYGSAVALAYVPIRRRSRSDVSAAVAFGAGCQAMALTLFPTLGKTPPPWRWQARVLLSSVSIHALYAATVARCTGQVVPRRT